MKKEALGSVSRTVLQVGSGLIIGSAVSKYDISYETLEMLLNTFETLGAILAIVTAQIWSIMQKMEQKNLLTTEQKKVETYENLNT